MRASASSAARRGLAAGVRRHLSTAPAPASAAPATTSRGWLFPTVMSTAAGSAIAGTAAYFTAHRFSHEPEFRAWVRQYDTASRYVEDGMAEYAPASWARSVRIDDDLAAGADAAPSPEAAELLRHAPNVGGAAIVPPTVTDSGRYFYSRLVDAAAAATPAFAPSVPAAAKPYSPLAELLDGDKAVKPPPVAALEPMAADDESDGAQGSYAVRLAALEASVSASSLDCLIETTEALEATGGPDGAAYASAEPLGSLAAWTAAEPPTLPTRLRVPSGAARAFGRAMLAYEATLARLEGGEAGEGRLLQERLRKLEAEEREASVSGAARGAESEGWRLIALPDAFFGDHSYADDDAPAGSQAAVGAARSAEEVTALRVGWLRVREAYARAELASIKAQLAGVEKHAEEHAGGATAMLRMGERRRRLLRTVEDLEAEKARAKKGRGARGLRPDWASHGAAKWGQLGE